MSIAHRHKLGTKNPGAIERLVIDLTLSVKTLHRQPAPTEGNTDDTSHGEGYPELRSAAVLHHHKIDDIRDQHGDAPRNEKLLATNAFDECNTQE